MITSRPDSGLFERFDHRRDEPSFRALYRAHTPMLFALALRLVGERPGAEELIQETWVRAIERHEHFDRRSQYRTWLVGVLINCAHEARRRRAKAPASLDTDEQTQAIVAVLPRAADGPADAIDIERALSKLPAGYREVVILHDINGYTHAEIAAMLGIGEGSSKSQLSRGRARLRALLSGDPPARRGERGR